jgi:hypothetical protein
MPMRDGSDSNHLLPVVRSGHADEDEECGSLLLLNASILVLVASLVGMAITVSFGNPAKVLADIKASLTDISALRTDTIQSSSTIQSTADANASPPTVWGAPARDEIVAVPEPANHAQTENNEPPSGTLLGQFQAWAAEEDARAQKPVEAVQVAPAEAEENSPAFAQPVQKHRKARSIQNARAEMRYIRKSKAKIQREQNARGQAPSGHARTQEQPVQNAQAPSFLLGLHQ